MSKIIDMTGQKFGKLIVIKQAKKPLYVKAREAYWLCKCSCGNEKWIRGSELRRGKTISCGCIKSKGEKRISELLVETKIPFESQYSPINFHFSQTNGRCYFDFFINKEYFIEFDGEQHFHAGKNGWYNKDVYLKTVQHDKEKMNIVLKTIYH